jgi:hypothetical protein
MRILSFLSGFKSSGSSSKISASSSYHKFNIHPSYHKNPAVKSAFRIGVKTGRNQMRNK